MQRKLIFSIAILFALLPAGCATNPITGRQELMFFPEQHDVEIGRTYAPEIEKQMGGRIDDPALQNYIDSVGQRIARLSHRPDLPYHFIAVDHNSVNAFALPGGYVYITKGMLAKLNTEAQLAGILAHEITHIVARDSSAAMSRQIGINLVLSTITSEKTPQNARMVADITKQIMSLQYSRKDERQADLTGLSYMTEAGFNPYGMVQTMQILQAQQQIRPIEFFSTHPAPQSRIAYLTEEIHSKYYATVKLKVGTEQYRRNVLDHLSN
ncbi:MAG: M48 family metalloprotease [Sedimentisphaerales bacterium]|nr:M48 family metalloprotease [Sedimentisphaerales bacterium]